MNKYPLYTKRDVDRMIVESLFRCDGTLNELQAIEKAMCCAEIIGGKCSKWIIKRHKELTNNVH